MTYVIELLTLTHVSMTASAYLIIFAAIERCLLTINDVLMHSKPEIERAKATRSFGPLKFMQTYRMPLACLAILCGALGKGTMYWEYYFIINKFPTCHEGQLKYKILFIHFFPDEQYTDIMNDYDGFVRLLKVALLYIQNFYLTTAWKFYFRNIFTVLIPFFALLFLLCLITIFFRLSSSSKPSSPEMNDRANLSARKMRIRAMTNTLIVIVITYLVSNVLSVIISLMEFFYSHDTLLQTFLEWYILSVDILSILSMLASCTRLPIYIYFQPLLRKEMKQFIMECCRREKHSRRMTYLESPTRPVAVLLNPENDDVPSPTDSSSVSKIVFV
ncbi:hypothetical protein WR25_17708 [Diploscapter pachys]|uniref:G-protein coupled receptors family 1 profile domain-containing protein n=1 Tax=Diploscapter pachys TaxID=2018661 RepID=A0A2A2LA60_9BILA|nr:hypothetical protein WR25_17708 [Diploscapter pachys]